MNSPKRSGDGVRGHRARSESAPKAKPVSPARWSAFQILLAIETSSAHSDDLLHDATMKELSQADRNLATALVMGVLRWQIALDADLTKLFDRPDQPLPEAIRIALRLGAFQLRHMDRIPPHAALSESVELVRAAGHPKAAGLANAILRKLSTLPRARTPIAESLEAMGTRLGHPAWMARRWQGNYGRESAQAICEYDQQEPSRGNLFAPDESVEGDEHAERVEQVERVDHALIDDGSRLVAELAAVSHASPARIWDACAAPGGKTAVLAFRHPNAELLATDINSRRLDSMRQRLKTELPERSIHTLKADATKLPDAEGDFDLILCDVPCSGTGTLARNPEIRHRLEPAELSRQAARQKEILAAALKRLRPGGRVVYSTCSLEPEENEAVVDAVLSTSADAMALVSPLGLLDELRTRGIVRQDTSDLNVLVRGDALRTLPGANFQGDGFFAVVIAREP